MQFLQERRWTVVFRWLQSGLASEAGFLFSGWRRVGGWDEGHKEGKAFKRLVWADQIVAAFKNQTTQILHESVKTDEEKWRGERPHEPLLLMVEVPSVPMAIQGAGLCACWLLLFLGRQGRSQRPSGVGNGAAWRGVSLQRSCWGTSKTWAASSAAGLDGTTRSPCPRC